MSKRSSRALLTSIYEGDCVVLGNNALDYTKTKNLYVEEEEIVKKPTRREKRDQEKTLTLVNGKEDVHASLNKGAISKRTVHCSCNKCKEFVDGTLISYIHLSSNNKSVPFVTYSCIKCGHTGYRSVQAKALPPEEFDRLYFS